MLYNRVNYFNKYIKKDILISKYFFSNIFQIPNIENITLIFLFNNSKKKSKYYIATLFSCVYLITGQYPSYIRSKKKVIIGCKIILRKSIMYFFLDKLNTLCLTYLKTLKFTSYNIINRTVYQFCFKYLGLFYEIDTLYKNVPKYLSRFNQNVNCFIYIKFKQNLNDINDKSLLSLNQISLY